jgi:DNA integrity scanning protein DisA with diadenylate cyclase activity
MNDYRAVRKVLQMSSSDIKLLSDSGYIFGLGKIIGTYDEKLEDLFFIRFTKYFTWELLHNYNKLMQVEYGQPRLPKTELDKTKFEEAVKKTFKEIKPEQIEKLWNFVIVAAEQKHGTIVVISSEAEKEAKRLGKQSIKIKPILLNPQIIKKVTAIDGAILIEPSTICHAIGVILDGLASDKGTLSIGARYNSAIRYVESSKNPCLVIVVSQDGMKDLVQK